MSAISILSTFTATVSAFPAPTKKCVYEGGGTETAPELLAQRNAILQETGGECQKIYLFYTLKNCSVRMWLEWIV